MNPKSSPRNPLLWLTSGLAITLIATFTGFQADRRDVPEILVQTLSFGLLVGPMTMLIGGIMIASFFYTRARNRPYNHPQ